MASETACEFDQLQTAVETKSSQSDSYVEVLNENPAWTVIGEMFVWLHASQLTV